jgi:hypothetical protein
MFDIILPFAINDLEGRELLAVGSKLDATEIVSIASKGRQMEYEHRCMLEHGSIRSDLKRYMNDGEYSLFSEAQKELRLIFIALVTSPSQHHYSIF